MNKTEAWKDLVKVTLQQEEALTSLSPLTVVSAGAGTGKTQTLAYRYAWLAANDEECGVGDILVLTFTKKAAREMQERIKKTLSEWGEACPEEYGRLTALAASIEDGYISTIHSFSMKMLREAGLELDIDPTSSIIPAPKEDIWWDNFAGLLSENSFGRIKDMLPENWRGKADIAASHPKLLETISALTPNTIAGAAKTCSDKLYCAGQTPESLWEHDGSELMASILSVSEEKKQIFVQWRSEVIPALGAISKKDASGQFAECIRGIAARWTEAELSDENADLFFEDLVQCLTLRVASKGKLKELLKDVLQTELTLYKTSIMQKAALMRLPSREEADLSSLLCRICALAWACWDEYRKREHMLTQSDLIYYACRLLKASPEYRRKFRHIMIDEFQDTDPLQNELVRALWNDPEENDGFQNTLFIVGDQKQSIYRFRHADLTLFNQYIARCMRSKPDICRYVSLDQNFRTAAGLLDKFNMVFGPLWQAHDDGIRYEALRSPSDLAFTEKRNAEASKPQLETLTALEPSARENETSEKANTEQLKDRLYSALGLRFAEMREKGVKVWDKKKGEAAPVRWRDFAVLVPSRSQYAAIERSFDTLGIPYILTTNKSFFGRSEVSDLVNMISLLAHPYDALYLGGWLSSPLSGLDLTKAQDLINGALQRKERRKPLPLIEAVRSYDESLFETLEALRRTALLNGVSAMILELLKRPVFLNHYSGARRRRANANIIYLAQLAEEYEASQGKSLLGCAEYLQKAVLLGGAKEEPDIEDEETDAVKVMTVHASKGLEFPVVALFCPEGRKKVNSERIFVSNKYGVIGPNIPPNISSSGAAEKTCGALWEKTEESAAEEAEKRRLLYVGFTRAQDRLILCSVHKETQNEVKNGRRDGLIADIEESGAADAAVVLTEETDSVISCARPPRPAAAPCLKLKITAPARIARITASAYALLSWCPAAYRMVYRQGRTVGWTVKGGEGEGSDFGSLAHWILARWDFTQEQLAFMLPADDSESSVRKASAGLPAELQAEFGSAAKRAEIRSLLERYAASREGRDFAAMASADSAVKLRREMPFRAAEDGLVMVGATDIYWHDSDGLHLRDWKSSDEKFAPAAYYESQLEFYAYALSRFYKNTNEPSLPIDSAVIYLRSPDAERNVRRYSADDFKRIKENIDKCAAEALSLNITSVGERCGVCPWQRECRRRVCS